jgi:hypothetical protein
LSQINCVLLSPHGEERISGVTGTLQKKLWHYKEAVCVADNLQKGEIPSSRVKWNFYMKFITFPVKKEMLVEKTCLTAHTSLL